MVKKILATGIRMCRPLLGIAGVCRYTVTCTAYAEFALGHYSFIMALYKIVTRVLRCNFFFKL